MLISSNLSTEMLVYLVWAGPGWLRIMQPLLTLGSREWWKRCMQQSRRSAQKTAFLRKGRLGRDLLRCTSGEGELQPGMSRQKASGEVLFGGSRDREDSVAGGGGVRQRRQERLWGNLWALVGILDLILKIMRIHSWLLNSRMTVPGLSCYKGRYKEFIYIPMQKILSI